MDALNDSTDASDDEDDFDDVDNLTAAILRDRMGAELEFHHRGELLSRLNNIDSPVQTIRDSFSLMPKVTEEDFDNIASRMSRIPSALAGYRESLSEAASTGDVASHRQIDAVINQCELLGDTESQLDHLGLSPDSHVVGHAKEAFLQMADWLSTELSPQASHNDGVGRERYQLFAEFFHGREVDLDAGYEWAQEQLAHTVEEQRAIAHELYGDVSVAGAYRNLNQDERYLVHGVDEIREWMQDVADDAIAGIDGEHFDIPPEIATIECKIDPAGTGAIFYTPPSDDMLRPGTMWWSVPEGQETFHTWQELTTVHHEGVPGHHLQLGSALVQEDLNLWRRAVTWNSGHGEGWALYAEQLMAELGYMDDPGFRMGMLDAQRLRAARVVVDIGLHLGKQLPDCSTSGVWDKAHVKTFMRENTAMDDANLNFEVNRYLGWPGQAPAYALGYRDWLTLRDKAVAQGMDLRRFHDKALRLGSMPMDLLASEVLNH